jgi:hypothetical protein
VPTPEPEPEPEPLAEPEPEPEHGKAEECQAALRADPTGSSCMAHGCLFTAAIPSFGMEAICEWPGVNPPQPLLPPASCSNGVQDGDETDIDCGGSCVLGSAGACDDSSDCVTDSDCKSGHCFDWPAGSKALSGSPTCVSCSNNIQDGDEDAADCGGSCQKCACSASEVEEVGACKDATCVPKQPTHCSCAVSTRLPSANS